MRNGAASDFLKTGLVEALRKVKAPDEIKEPSGYPYPFCANVGDYFKLDKKVVYQKLIDGDFSVAPSEITKTKQGTPC